jgi:hypothetical protein
MRNRVAEWALATVANRLSLAGLALSWLCAAQTAAGEVQGVAVEEHDGVYHIRVQAMLDAPMSRVWEVLTDYRHLHRVNPSISESELLPAQGDGLVRVRTRIEDCVVLICRALERVEEVHELGPSAIIAETLPGSRDFKSGTARWNLGRAGDRTLLVYESWIEPDFFVPPLIGPALLKKKLQEQTVRSLERIECVAQAHAPRGEEAPPRYGLPQTAPRCHREPGQSQFPLSAAQATRIR